MCWDYSDCGACGKRTQCSASCYCSDDDECVEAGHRDCKSFNRCSECGDDLCDDCWEESHYCDKVCKKTHKINKLEFKLKRVKDGDNSD